MIWVVESRSDLNRRIIGQVTSDWNFADLESTEHGVETREMQNRDMIWAIELRLDMDRRIIGQVIDLESTEHGVETHKMWDNDKIWTIGSMEISTIDQTQWSL